jgi:cardiolipin synthase
MCVKKPNDMKSATSWTFYRDNPSIWNALLEACESATTSIDLENFIFESDEIGNRFIDVCARKAAQGVRVRFIWDAAGSFTFFKSSIIEDLKKKGIELRFFKTFVPNIFSLHKYRSWYFRNHRRTVVIDKKIGFTGSTSISARMTKWRDTMVRMEGPVVCDMELAFEQMWMRAIGKRVKKRPEDLKSDFEFEYVSNTPVPRNRHLYRRLVEAIRNSEKYIYITTPYFVPTHKLMRVLRLAAHRGVDVLLILPAASDFPLVDLGARTFFHQMLKAGINVHLYKTGMIHVKSVVIDGDWATLGTLNLDNIGLLYNYEANLVTTNAHFAEEMKEHFEEDLKSSERITFEDWNRRFFIEKIATVLVKLIRSFL